MDLSIIIVNWNSKDYLQKCIASLLASTSGIKYEIIVIDSGSFDGAGEMIEECYTHVRFIQSDRNLGFSRANNFAFNMSEGRNILFLNPDTEIEGTAIETMNQWLDSLPSAGIVGAKLLSSDRSIQTSCVQAFPTILNQLIDADVLRNAFPRAKIWGMAPLFSRGTIPSEVDAVSGASLMVKRSVFKGVGMFSDDYFMYSEDIDLCFKVRKSGWKIYYVPLAVIVHHGGTSSSKSSINAFSDVLMLESRLIFFQKTRSSLYCLLYRFEIFIAGLVRIGLAMLMWPLYGLLGRKLICENVIIKWIAILRWSFGREKWVKNL